MKKILLITLLLIPVLGFSQTNKPIDSFSGIKFGSSKLAIITTLKAKGAVIQQNTKDQIMLSNVKLGSRFADMVVINFIANKAYGADFFFKPDVEGHTIDLYGSLVSDYTNVYGSGTPTTDYTSPYQEGDGNTYLGLSSGKIKFHTDWLDTNSNNTVSIMITPVNSELNIQISYVNDKLYAEYEKSQNAQNKSDL